MGALPPLLSVLLCLWPALLWAEEAQLQDQAGILADPTPLQAVVDELRLKGGIRLWIFTLPRLNDSHAEHAGTAQKLQALEPEAGGILLLVEVEAKRVSIASGARLGLAQKSLDDIKTRIIIPRLREDDYQQGLLNGVQALAHLAADKRGVSLSFPPVKMEPGGRWWRKTSLEPRHLWLPGLILLWYAIIKIRKRKKNND